MTLFGNTVRVYRNLHKKCYSVQLKGPQGWRVSGYFTNGVHYLTNVRPVVSQAGQRRAMEEGRKNVHAFLEGHYQGQSFIAIDDLTLAYKDVVRLMYSLPRGQFINAATFEPVEEAREVWLTSRGVYARGVTYAASR